MSNRNKGHLLRLTAALTAVLTAAALLTSCGRVGTSYTDQLEDVAAVSAQSDSTAKSNADGQNDGSPSGHPAGETAENAASGSSSPEMDVEVVTDQSADSAGQGDSASKDQAGKKLPRRETVRFDPSWEYADYSKIHTDSVTLWHAQGTGRKDIIVAVNAGHGCAGGESEQTQCHPDGSPKVTGGSTSSGAVTATAINGGMTFNDGTKEAAAVLSLARLLKDELLKNGYDVLMIRDNEDTQLDNIARTVFANNAADCHVSLHYDSTEGDKGFFYIRVPEVASYRAMEPVASHWEQHNALGEAILGGASRSGVRIFSGGSIALDLTQTSYSTVPSVDVEVGDKSSDHSEAAQKPIAEGIAAGIDDYFSGSRIPFEAK